MKYMRQITIILIISLAGEILHLLVPLPVPAGIYGLLIMLTGLTKKWIPLEAVEETGTFLIEIMPLMFISPAAGLLDSWVVLQSILVPFLVITLISTIIVMVITGKVTQLFIKYKGKGETEKNE